VIPFFVVSSLTVLFDQLTKQVILGRLSEGQSLSVVADFFHLTYVRNQGIAFGLLQPYQTLLFWMITLSIVLLAVIGLRVAARNRVEGAALALIMGGAVGNWIDRVTRGAVIDFLDFRVWPVFNFADTAITVGVAVYLLLLLRPASRSARSGAGS
jgi:signal peptidase II